MKKVSLRELVADKIVFAALIAVYYWMWARTTGRNSYRNDSICCLCVFVYYFVNRAIRLKNISRKP